MFFNVTETVNAFILLVTCRTSPCLQYISEPVMVFSSGAVISLQTNALQLAGDPVFSWPGVVARPGITSLLAHYGGNLQQQNWFLPFRQNWVRYSRQNSSDWRFLLDSMWLFQLTPSKNFDLPVRGALATAAQLRDGVALPPRVASLSMYHVCGDHAPF